MAAETYHRWIALSSALCQNNAPAAPKLNIARGAADPPQELSDSRAAHSRDEGLRCLADLIRHARLRRNKLRREPRKQPDQIVRHQNLALAMLARPDAVCRNRDCLCDLRCHLLNHVFEHYRHLTDLRHLS